MASSSTRDQTRSSAMRTISITRWVPRRVLRAWNCEQNVESRYQQKEGLNPVQGAFEVAGVSRGEARRGGAEPRLCTDLGVIHLIAHRTTTSATVAIATVSPVGSRPEVVVDRVK